MKQQVVPTFYSDIIQVLQAPFGQVRDWRHTNARLPVGGDGNMREAVFAARVLRRLTVDVPSAHLREVIDEFQSRGDPCLQIDFSMQIEALDACVGIARSCGFVFCAWLPAALGPDWLRMQRVDAQSCDFAPAVVNPQAQRLLTLIQGEVTRFES